MNKMIEVSCKLQLQNKTHQKRIKCTNRRVGQKIRLYNKQIYIEATFYEKEWSFKINRMLKRSWKNNTRTLRTQRSWTFKNLKNL